MALIYCRECGRQVSDKAAACPHCGYPMNTKNIKSAGSTVIRKPGADAPASAVSDVSGGAQAVEAASFSDSTKEGGSPAGAPQDAGVSASLGSAYAPDSQKAVPSQSMLPVLLKNKKVIAIAAVLVLLIVIAAAVTAAANAHCNYGGCRNTRVKGGRYCATHTCAKSGCFNSTSEDDFYCYVHRTDFYGSESSGSYGSSYESASFVLSFSDIDVSSNSSYTICTGTLTNNGSKTYKFVEVKGAFQDSSGTVLDTDWTYAVGSEGLEPGESTSFRMSVPKNSSIRKCEVSLLDYDT